MSSCVVIGSICAVGHAVSWSRLGSGLWFCWFCWYEAWCVTECVCVFDQNCLRRRDAGLISQLQELDRQISDLRLDTEASHDLLETDSRPSSGTRTESDQLFIITLLYTLMVCNPVHLLKYSVETRHTFTTFKCANTHFTIEHEKVVEQLMKVTDYI